MKKRSVFRVPAIITAALIILSAGCSDINTNKEDEISKPKTSSEQSETENTAEKIHTTSSSLTSPLDMDTWGTAAKYSTSEQKYYNVPVRITSAIYGKDAEIKIKDALKKDPAGYEFTAAQKDQKWAVVTYELSLDGFPVDDGGADASITSFVTAEDGGYLSRGGKDDAVVTMNLYEEKYYFEGIVSGQTAMLIPKECDKFILCLGEYGETQAFFIPDIPKG